MNTGLVLHHCQIILDQYLQSQTPTISKHSLTTYISFTVSGQTQSNKLVYWETRICWKIENIFWSDQWPSTNKLLWKTNKNLQVICRKSRRSLILASSSGPSIRMTSSTGEDMEEGGRKYLCNYFFNLQRLLQLSVSRRKCLWHNKILLAAGKVGAEKIQNTILVVF